MCKRIMKTLFLDLETTGLQYFLHGIVQMSFIIDIDNKEVDRRNFFIRPFPADTMDHTAIDVHKLSLAELRRFPKPQYIHPYITAIFDQYINKYQSTDKFILVGFRTSFDLSFLIEFFKKCNDSYLGSYIDFKRTIDLYEIVKFYFLLNNITLENYKLETVSNHFDIPIRAHDAMSDIEATRHLFYTMKKNIQKITGA